MKIELTSNERVAYRPYRLPYSQRRIMKEQVEKLLDAGIIEESTSNYASPAILVKKHCGEERLCIDYRQINSITKREEYPMPIVSDQLDQLGGHKFFTSLDLASGYYQVPVDEESRPLTAFITAEGQYQFKKMPFGLVNGPAVFQRLMNSVFR